MSRPVVLTIEDDSAIRRGICDALRFAGYDPLEAADGLTGLKAAATASYDLLLLDLVLPGRSGLEILAEVRRIRPTQPVIILTALGQEDDRVAGLRLGSDDYISKPFSVKELLARIDAVLRRSPERPRELSQVRLPGLVADLARCEVQYEDRAFGQGSGATAIPRRKFWSSHFAGRTAAASLAAQSARPRDADHRHAYHTPAREAPGRCH